MAFTVGTFLGGVVRGFGSNISWGVGAPSSLTVQLVDDASQAAFFSPPPVWSPVFLQFYGFKFAGLLQKWEKRNGPDGSPVYDVLVVDPREILEGAQIIVGAYGGSVGFVKNLFNAYGFWEARAFGASLANESGMPWVRVRQAVELTANVPSQSTYGGPLSYGGFTYSLDLSEVPTPPSYYRIGGGVSVSLLEAIAQVCEDGGRDFFVELDGFTIRVRTVSRALQPPLGTISALAGTNFGTVVRSSSGLECRNEVTSAFLVGGDVTTLHLTDALTPFWGFDLLGNPITGTAAFLWIPAWVGDGQPAGTQPVMKLSPTRPRRQGDWAYFQHADADGSPVVYEEMVLNAAPVSDVVGSTAYRCSTLEMRLAQANFESWQTYLHQQRPDIAGIIGSSNLFAPKRPDRPVQAAMRPLFVNAKAADAKAAAKNSIETDVYDREHRLYEFVRGYADEYMGKKYLAGLPFLLAATDPETLKVRTTYDISDGGYLPDGAAPLGLSAANEDLFTTPDGRLRAFVNYPSLAGADLSKISPAGTAVDAGGFYAECQVSPQVVLTPTPAAVITIQGPLVEKAADPFGDAQVPHALLQKQPAEGKRVLKQAVVPVKVAPAVRHPSVAAVPLRSNALTYGPWYAQGAPGRVRVDYDPSLTPWNYGSFAAMSLAGTARVAQAVTNMQVSEVGVLELADAPAASLGDVLQLGGPNVTGVDVSCDAQNGVSTAYRFQTFSPRFGVFGKGYVERLKRIGLAGMELRRALRTALRESLAAGEAVGNAARTARAYRERHARAKKRETPHDVLHAFSDAETSEQGDEVVRTHVAAATMEEAVVLSNADDDALHKKTAVMGLSGLLRPFATSAAAGTNMPSLLTPGLSNCPNRTSLDPWKAKNDVEVYSWGETYKDLHAYEAGGDHANARALGLRAPLVLVGWGYGVDGKPVPAATGDPNAWHPLTLTKQSLWKAGPADLLWDERRGVWTCHDVLKGVVTQDVPADLGGPGRAEVYQGAAGTGFELDVWSWGGGAEEGDRVALVYNVVDNRWFAVAAGGGGATAGAHSGAHVYRRFDQNVGAGRTDGASSPVLPNSPGFGFHSTQLVGGYADVRVVWDSLAYDTDGYADLADLDRASRLTAPFPGKYRIEAAVFWAAYLGLSEAGFQVALYKNAAPAMAVGNPVSAFTNSSVTVLAKRSAWLPGPNGNVGGYSCPVQTVEAEAEFAAGDYVELLAAWDANRFGFALKNDGQFETSPQYIAQGGGVTVDVGGRVVLGSNRLGRLDGLGLPPFLKDYSNRYPSPWEGGVSNPDGVHSFGLNTSMRITYLGR